MLKRILAVLTAGALITLGLGATPAQAAGPYYYYAGAWQTITTTKLAANLSVENPYAWTTDHVVAELAVIRGSGTSMQAIEVGWIVNRDLNGDADTKLFSYAWKDGVGLGYGTGGFVNYCPSGTTPCTTKQQNDVLVASGGSALASKAFVIEYMTFNGNTGWWVAYDGNYFGYWPATLWSSANGGAFVSGERVDIFGEVFSYSTGPCSDMGVNYLPTATTGAFAGSTTINGTSTGVNLSTHVTSSTHYNAVMATGSTRSFRYGGDGWC